MNALTQTTTEITSHFEYCYCAKKIHSKVRALIVSFPGRKSNRLADSSNEITRPFLWDTLVRSDADVLFMRSVYKTDPTSANMTDDYDLLPEFLFNIKKKNKIDRLVLFGFSLGCGPCLWLARKHIAEDVVLIAPGEPILPTLGFFDDIRWQLDFERFCASNHSPQISTFPSDFRLKIVHGLNLEPDRLRELNLVHYLKHLAPQAELEAIPNVGHYIPQFWQENGVLQERIFDVLGVNAANHTRDHLTAMWSNLNKDYSFNYHLTGSQDVIEQKQALG